MAQKISETPGIFGQWLRRKRKERGLSQEELGRRIERTKAHISALERAAPHASTGKPAKVTPAGCKALARALNVPVEEALRTAEFLAPLAHGEDPRRLRLVAYFDGLSDEERDHAIALMESLYLHRKKP